MAKKKRNLHGPEDVAKGKKSGFAAGGAGKSVLKEDKSGKGGVNLFERLWNRKKFEIVGKKVKGEQRSIGKARSEAIEKRNKSLLREFKERNKSNAFLDHRFGEKNEALQDDEKAILRFQKERLSQLSRKSKFSLENNDEEEEMLTHKGAPLRLVDDFKDEVENDDDDELDKLDEEMVRELHFGGGEFSEMAKSEKTEQGDRPKTKKEIMSELIAKSKFFKAQKQKEKEEDDEMRQKLDSEFRDLSQSRALLSLFRPSKRSGIQINDIPVKDGDDYESLAKSLVFDMRAHAGDRTKTEEEIATHEKELLLEMEKKRKRRMAGFTSSDEENEEEGGKGGKSRVKKNREISGDDLGENFELDEDEDKKGWVDEILERENEPDSDEDDEEDSEADGEEDEEDDGEEGEEGEEEDDDEDGSEVGEAGEQAQAMEEGFEAVDGGEDDLEDEEEGFEVEEEDGEDGEGGLEGESEEDVEERNGDISAKKMVGGNGSVAGAEAGGKEGRKSVGTLEPAELKPKVGLKAKKVPGGSELPFVIDAPQTLLAMQTLVDNRSNAELAEAIKRIRTCNAISLAAENRKKMQIFYGVLLQYFAVTAGKQPLQLDRLDAMTAPLIEMTAVTPLFAAICARERILKMHQKLSDKLKEDPDETDPNWTFWPGSRVLLLVRLWSLIFPPSDFRHPVMTPVLLLLGESLTRCPVRSLKDMAIGAFICSLLLSLTREAKRYCPEALVFLHAALRTAIDNKNDVNDDSIGLVIPSYVSMLVSSQPWLRTSGEAASLGKSEPINFCQVMSLEAVNPFFRSDNLKLNLTASILQTLSEFARIYRDLPSFPEVFCAFLPTLEALSEVHLSEDVEKARERLYGELKQGISEVERVRQPLRMRVKKAVPIRQYNPRFEENFEKGRDYDIDRERSERKKMQKLIKKETRGAVRELKKDNFFLAEERRRERMGEEQESAEQHRKTMAFLQEQEHAYKSGQLGSRKGKKKRR